MEKFYKLPKLTQGEVNNLYSPISIKEIEFIVKYPPQRKVQGQMSLSNSTKYLRNNTNSTQTSPENKRIEYFLTHL